MGDGVTKNEHYIDSTSPTAPHFRFIPNNFRDIIQKQVQRTVDKQVDAVVNLSIGKFDGRYLNQFPGTETTLDDNNGNYYFVVGTSRVGDLTVAAP